MSHIVCSPSRVIKWDQIYDDGRINFKFFLHVFLLFGVYLTEGVQKRNLYYIG